jgi:hypothetical protein
MRKILRTQRTVSQLRIHRNANRIQKNLGYGEVHLPTEENQEVKSWGMMIPHRQLLNLPTGYVTDAQPSSNV